MRVVTLAVLLLLLCSAVSADNNCSGWTTHTYQGQVYYHNNALDESTIKLPNGCTAETISKQEENVAPATNMWTETATTYSTSVKKIQSMSQSVANDDITLTLQGDFNRVKSGAIARLAKQWQGPISAAVLVTNDKANELDNFLKAQSNESELKKWVDVNVVLATEKWKHYPINQMRNVALSQAKSSYVFVLDIDESLPFTMQQMQNEVQKASAAGKTKNTIFTLASWQWANNQNNPQNGPKSFPELLKMHSDGLVAVKYPHFPQAYSVPNHSFLEWQELQEAKEIEYVDSFEPYFVAQKSILHPFDERFVGFGANKASLILKLALERYQFVVLPRLFAWAHTTPNDCLSHSAVPNPNLINDAWREMGKAYGCDNCQHDSCVKNCPQLVRHVEKMNAIQTALVP